MIDLSDCLMIGKITKTHGIRGQVVLRLNNYSFDDIIEMETVFMNIDGFPVPFFVSEYSEKNSDSLILKFEDIKLEAKARKLIDCQVYIPTKALVHKMDLPDSSDLILGYEVFDLNYGRLGILENIIDVQQNPLFRILNGSKEILIPMQQKFIHKIDKSEKRITLNSPSGLIDLF